jgi:hypothetical protein
VPPIEKMLIFKIYLKNDGVFTIFSAFLLTLENRGCFSLEVDSVHRGPFTFWVTLKIRLFFLKKIDFPDALIQDVKKIDVKTVFINEPGLYSLIIEFQKWVYDGFKNVGVFP